MSILLAAGEAAHVDGTMKGGPGRGGKVLRDTRQAWPDGYERRESRLPVGWRNPRDPLESAFA